MKAITIILLTLSATGCAMYPSKVSLPNNLGETDIDKQGRPAASATSSAKHEFSRLEKQMGIQPMATTREMLLYQLNLLIGDWNNEAGILLGERDTIDNVNFWGIVTGAALIADDKIRAAKGVAAAVAGANLISENYKIAIQASNYIAAAETAECIRTQVLEVSETAWTKFLTPNGSVRPALGLPEEQKTALSAIFPQINSALSSVYKKLRTNQRTVRVSAPTADSISKAISDTQKQVGVVDSLGDKAFTMNAGNRTFFAVGVTNDDDLWLLKQLLAVAGKAQTCATAMGG